MDFTDPRDGKIYPCVQMPDGKWWFAKNLSYATPNSHTYNDDPVNEPIYGRLYSWDDLVNACPPGCHIPIDDEWTALTTAIGADAGTKLKANSSLWSTNTGTDVYGFSVLPAGGRFNDGTFSYLGYYAVFWSSSEYVASYAWIRYFDYTYAYVYRYNGYETYGFSLRCIVDVVSPPPPTDPAELALSYQNRPSDSMTLQPIAYQGSFTSQSGRQRITSGMKSPVLSTTLSYQVDSLALASMKRLFDTSGKPVAFNLADFPLTGINTAIKSTSGYSISYGCSSGTFSFPCKMVIPDARCSIPDPGQISICPFPLPAETLTGSELVKIISVADPNAALTVSRQRGTDLTLKWYSSMEGMYQFFLWWWKFSGCGRRRFIANVVNYPTWFFEFLSEPIFTIQNGYCFITAKISGVQKDLQIDFESEPPLTASQSSTFTLAATEDSLSKSILYNPPSHEWRGSATLHSVAFDSEGTPVGQSLWSGSVELYTSGGLQLANHIVITIGNIPKGNYRFCIYGASLISKWYLINIA